jgi:ABC-2 type transport system ATP-binding protein
MRRRYELGVSYHLKLKGNLDGLDDRVASVSLSLVRVATAPVDEFGFHEVIYSTALQEDFGSGLIQVLAKVDGLHLRECFRKESDLEDVFLAATKRSWDESSHRSPDSRYSSIPPGRGGAEAATPSAKDA